MQKDKTRHLELDVPVEQLIETYQALIHALAEQGRGAEEIDSLLRHCLVFECVGCGIRLTPEELQLLTAQGSENDPPRIRRIRLGYCARNSCDSRFYKISVQKPGQINWHAVFQRALQLRGEIASALSEQSSQEDQSPQNRRLRKRLLLALVLLLAALIVFLWRYRPWSIYVSSHQTSPFQIDTNSLIEW